MHKVLLETWNQIDRYSPVAPRTRMSAIYLGRYASFILSRRLIVHWSRERTVYPLAASTNLCSQLLRVRRRELGKVTEEIVEVTRKR